MKLQDRLPDGVTVDGRFYRLDFDFRNVLKMTEIMARDDLMPEARDYLAVKCFTKHPRNVGKVLAAVLDTLFDETKDKDERRLTDFVQDAPLIRAAFLQAYGINLYRDRLHWIEFRELLGALPDGSRYREVVSIRARPIPAPTKWNEDERAWLIKAKAEVALHMSEEEREKQYRKDVANIATILLAWAGDNNG